MYQIQNAFTWYVINGISEAEAVFFHSLGFYNIYKNGCLASGFH